ncbi:MAG: Lrp/AsnC family transcriptional regulator [Lentisphaerae bacterium]|nr:Lrp/AsnC family transcriptional regulator [Lentisphaerota bacterium]
MNKIASSHLEIPGVTGVCSVAGVQDPVTIVRVTDSDARAAMVREKMLKLDGLRKTKSLIAFKAYSRHDLEPMLSLGA